MFLHVTSIYQFSLFHLGRLTQRDTKLKVVTLESHVTENYLIESNSTKQKKCRLSISPPGNLYWYYTTLTTLPVPEVVRGYRKNVVSLNTGITCKESYEVKLTWYTRVTPGTGY